MRTLLAISGLLVVGYWAFTSVFGERALAQSDTFLARRIDQIENRFYSMESRLNRLEQSSSRPAASVPRIGDVNAVEIQALRNQMDSFRFRLGEVECGVLRLDERTLTVATRRGRGGAATGTERCRQNWGTPITLSARPE
ncbi:MAG TPA: hypothetical protein VNA17_03730 [Pyrinomonadaceae bacterium]|nr:hypothetical protein [Pyrinomonadaceae bacterium]